MKSLFTGRSISTRLITGILLLLTATLTLADDSGKSANGVRYGGGDEVILQGFHWNVVRTDHDNWYNELNSMASEIASDGFTTIWMPVPWRDDSSWSDASTGTYGGGEGYYWEDFNKNSQYGTDGQLHQAANALSGDGVKVIYDVVPNHMNRSYTPKAINFPAGQGYWRNDCYDPGPNQPNGCDDGDRFMGGESDLNTGKTEVYNLFKNEFINLVSNYDASGFRFDFVRGYAAERVDSWMGAADDNGFCVGELWKAPSEYPASDWRHSASWQDILKDWSDRSHCTVFDFALKERMQNGSVSDWRYGLNGNPDPRWREVAVTFVDNHDTGYSPGPNGGQHQWPLPDSKRKMAYAYILSSPGTPVVYWPHMYDWGLRDFIRQLIALRKSVGVKAYSPISFSNDYSGLVAQVTGTNGSLVLALDSNLDNPGQVASGTFTNVINTDSGQIRIWRTGGNSSSGSGGGASGNVNVHFVCQNGDTTMGDSVYAVGNVPELGNWDPSQAVLLADNSAYPTWQADISLPAGETVQWKCIIRSESNPTSVTEWQPGNNTQVTTATGATTTGSF